MYYECRHIGRDRLYCKGNAAFKLERHCSCSVVTHACGMHLAGMVRKMAEFCGHDRGSHDRDNTGRVIVQPLKSRAAKD